VLKIYFKHIHIGILLLMHEFFPFMNSYLVVILFILKHSAITCYIQSMPCVLKKALLCY
jgi:hypothetical protein